MYYLCLQETSVFATFKAFVSTIDDKFFFMF